MRSRPTFWILLCLLLLGGAWFFGRDGALRRPHKEVAPAVRPHLAANFTTTKSGSTAPQFLAGKISTNAVLAAKTNQFPWRLSNTKKSIGELMGDRHAILLENALIDTGMKLNLAIPKNLQAQGDPGAYIVQARGPIDNAFRAELAAAGAQIVSYIPNDAYLVTIPSGGAAGLSGQPDVQNVIPYEPYYKLPASLMPWTETAFPADRQLRVAAYPSTADATKAWLESSGVQILAEEPSSPFGKTFIVQNVTDVAALAQQPFLQRVEPVFRRVPANDLSRVAMGISDDTVTSTNYMNLSGLNVLVEMNDSGIDATHPDFSVVGSAEHPGTVPPSRVTGDFTNSLTDMNGHGTFVAGIIAGNGSQSYSVTNIPQGSVTNADFRGKAPSADLFSVGFLDVNGNSFDVPDAYLQAQPALTNALISNNSWNFTDDNVYDLAAASYDAAVRDALPLVTGSQPVLFVFSAGNDGGGDDFGGSGDADTILSPGTAKNVITVGALQEPRNITNIVTDINGNSNAVWQAGTQNGNLVASYSSRGNVGVGTEGAFGRFKPDVVAPGSFVVSTRSQQWNQAAYYNPTNFYVQSFTDQFISPNSQNNYNLSLNFVPPNITFNSNVVSVTIQIVPNADSPVPFPILPIYVSHITFPNPTNSATYDFVTTNNQVSIPNPDGGNSYLATNQSGNLFYTIVNTNSERVGFDLIEEITATNELGNYFTVLSNLNDTIGPWYRYESGTSMAAPAVSGALALMQDYFTNTLSVTPSPALLKAMLINGAQPVGNYSYAITNGLNFEGWGLVNVPDSVPVGITNQIGASCSSFLIDQSPANALATGDSQTFMVTVDTNDFAGAFPLQVTLAWTDPPGNPAAAIKLVNNLDLVITNLDTGEVYFGNDIAPNTTFNTPWDTNTTPNLDSINNVENIIIPPILGGNYSVTVIGRSVNVNAVTAQTNNSAGNFAPNVVQDYALVISCSQGQVTTAITVMPPTTSSNPTSDQQITIVGVNTNGMATNSISSGGVFLNQFAGANTPLLGTNTVELGGTNEVVTLGMTNQWHFYVVPNGTTFTNAAFVTFLPDTLATPRMGVFAGSDANSTQPEADIDLYVSTDPSLTNLNPVVVSNCVNGTQIGGSVASVFNGASLGSGGTEFVVDTNSSATQVYYVGVKSETAEAAEYGFLPVFSQQPFSQMQNGNEVVNGLLLPVNIPDGSPKHPGSGYVFALAVQPIQVQDVIVSNQIVHQNFGDLTGTLTHDGTGVVLNNHDSPGNPLPPGPYDFIYDDGPAPVPNSQPPDGPGSLQDFQGQQGVGPWILTEVDNSLTQTGAVTGFSLLITPHQDLTKGVNVLIPPGGITNFFIDVPVGTTNLTISATNTTLPFPDTTAPPLSLGALFEKFGALPTPQQPPPPTNFDQMVLLTNFPPALSIDPGNIISVGQSDTPPIQPGRYFVTLWNPSTTLSQNFFIIATFGVAQVASVNFSSSGSVPLLDDAVTYAFITNNPTALETNETIAALNVGIRVDHPRISDLVFHLISPDGTRFLLMENRGGTSTNGAGVTLLNSNTFPPVASSGGSEPQTNIVDTGVTGGIVQIDYDFLTQPDEMTIYYESNQVFDVTTNGSGTFFINYGPGTSTLLTVVMNQNTNPQPTTLWNYTVHAVETNYLYLAFTEDTNLTTIPIKFAPPPFVPAGSSNLFYLPEQDISPLNGTSALGVWQLEIQDDRAGAGLTNSLLSWQLQFTFANTNFVPVPPTIGLTNNLPLTNVVPANSTSWFLVTVPPNADIATNDLIFATAPVNLLFNPTTPDTNGDFTLLANQLSGISILTTSSAPTNIVPGGIYYLGIQNTNDFPVTNAIEVTFHLFAAASPFAFTQPAQAVTGTNAQLNGMATPNGLPTTAWFEWGTNTSYGNQTPSVSVSNSFNVVYVTNSISLTPNVPYHFRLVVSNALAVVTGFDQILDEANVVVWGANFAGQLDVPTGLSNVVAIAGAYDHSLALKNDETVAVWGDDTFGQTNVPAGSNNNLVAVAGGESYSLALKNSETVIAWGGNIFPGETSVPAGLNNVVTIASGQYSSMALQNNGTVVAWGANISGLTNVPVNLTNNVVAIAGGSFHNLAVKNDGTVVAWGDDSAGQTNVPVGLTNVVAISGGSFHSLALKNDGTVVSWGDDSAGQTNVPVGLSNVVAVAAGGFHSLALKNDGSIVAWGDDSAGQTNVPIGLTNVVAIAGGNLHSLALTPFFNVNPTNPIVLSLSNGVPQTSTIGGGGIVYYQINVPLNADFATNLLLSASAPLNILFTTNTPPTTNGAAILLANMTNGVSVLSTTSFPTNITPGAVYYLGVQNTNAITVNYQIEVDFHLVTAPPVFISSIIHTNGGFLLTWFAPSNDLFQVQWNDNLGSTNWVPFTNPPAISYNPNFPASASNAQFNFFDDGSQTGGLPPFRFYRLILLQSTNPPPPANAAALSITSTNVSGTNGFLLTWFAPSNDLFQVQWTTNLAPASWGTFTNIISYNTNFAASAVSAQFNFLDDGSQTGGTLGAMRFYRLILLQGINSLTLPNQTNFTASFFATVTVTNAAVDSRNNAVLTYSLTNSPANATISTNGIITWTNATPSGLAARFNTVVTDNGAPPLTATNTFTIFVAPIPSITNVTVTATNVVLQWVAPTNDQFQVQWTTNLAPVITWTLFPNIITSTNGLFIFTDTNAPLLMKFYQLILLP